MSLANQWLLAVLMLALVVTIIAAAYLLRSPTAQRLGGQDEKTVSEVGDVFVLQKDMPEAGFEVLRWEDSGLGQAYEQWQEDEILGSAAEVPSVLTEALKTGLSSVRVVQFGEFRFGDGPAQREALFVVEDGEWRWVDDYAVQGGYVSEYGETDDEGRFAPPDELTE